MCVCVCVLNSLCGYKKCEINVMCRWSTKKSKNVRGCSRYGSTVRASWYFYTARAPLVCCAIWHWPALKATEHTHRLGYNRIIAPATVCHVLRLAAASYSSPQQIGRSPWYSQFRLVWLATDSAFDRIRFSIVNLRRCTQRPGPAEALLHWKESVQI